MSIQASLFNLAKYDNGMFKSDKQRDFILSQCDQDGLFVITDSVYNNPVRWFIQCDQEGVVSITKETRKESVQTFKRATGSDVLVAVQRGAEMKDKRLHAKLVSARINKALSIANKYDTNYKMNMVLSGVSVTTIVSIERKRATLEKLGMALHADLDKILVELQRK